MLSPIFAHKTGGFGVQVWLQIGVVGVALAVMLASSWDGLAARVGRAVSDAGRNLAGWTAGSGCLALWLLLGA